MTSASGDSPGQSHQRLKAESLMRMAGGMAHDFNNYLAAIQGNNELVIAQAPEDAPFSRSVQQIQNLTTASLGLTARIQLFACQAHVDKQRLDPVAFLAGQQDTLQALVTPGQRVTLVLPESAPGIDADSALLSLSIANAVTNASEALVDQQGVIRVACELLVNDGNLSDYHARELQADRYVVFEVSDDGPGMPERVYHTAFDPFMTTKIRGEGMGLPVVMGVAWSHGGAVQLETGEASGTRLRILIPAA